MSNEFTIGNLCACMGPQATDPYCPCRMRVEGLDGYYNCYGDKEAVEKRAAAEQERLRAAFAEMMTLEREVPPPPGEGDVGS